MRECIFPQQIESASIPFSSSFLPLWHYNAREPDVRTTDFEYNRIKVLTMSLYPTQGKTIEARMFSYQVIRPERKTWFCCRYISACWLVHLAVIWNIKHDLTHRGAWCKRQGRVNCRDFIFCHALKNLLRQRTTQWEYYALVPDGLPGIRPGAVEAERIMHCIRYVTLRKR